MTPVAQLFSFKNMFGQTRWTYRVFTRWYTGEEKWSKCRKSWAAKSSAVESMKDALRCAWTKTKKED